MKNMKQSEAVNQFLAGRRVAIAKFVAHRYKEVQNKAKKVVGIVNLYEVQCADGKAPTVQTWCPRNVQTVEQAAKEWGFPRATLHLGDVSATQRGGATVRHEIDAPQ